MKPFIMCLFLYLIYSSAGATRTPINCNYEEKRCAEKSAEESEKSQAKGWESDAQVTFCKYRKTYRTCYKSQGLQCEDDVSFRATMKTLDFLNNTLKCRSSSTLASIFTIVFCFFITHLKF